MGHAADLLSCLAVQWVQVTAGMAGDNYNGGVSGDNKFLDLDCFCFAPVFQQLQQDMTKEL